MTLLFHPLFHSSDLGLPLITQGSYFCLLLHRFGAFWVVSAKLLDLCLKLGNLLVTLLHIGVEFGQGSSSPTLAMQVLSVRGWDLLTLEDRFGLGVVLWVFRLFPVLIMDCAHQFIVKGHGLVSIL